MEKFFNPYYHLCNVILTLLFLAFGNSSSDLSELTYGSIVTLTHHKTNYKLTSSEASWSAGSGQKVVTLVKDIPLDSEDFSLWVLKPGHDLKMQPTGVKVNCGDTIRLENSYLKSNLHSHSINSALGSHYEVSTFGSEGLGDDLDNWIIVCDKKMSQLMEGESFYLKHAGLGGFLHAKDSQKFTHQNCPRCPIIGHIEVGVTMSEKSPAKMNDFCKWKFSAGLLFDIPQVDENFQNRNWEEL